MILRLQKNLKDVRRWWLRGNRRYGVWWRLGNGLAVLLLLVSIAIPTLQQLFKSEQYRLSDQTLQLVGKTDSKLAKQLTYDAATSSYQFNKAAVEAASNSPLNKLKSQVGTAAGSAQDKSLYGLDVPSDPSKGVTYHDINSHLSFSLVPQFKASSGQEVQGHLVYPLAGGTQAIYTLKGNGLKEDIVVPAASPSDSLTFSYKLSLPQSLEAKVIPGSGGAIGIYSADPALFGDISFGSDTDQAAVAKARISSPKTNLVFGLPAPVIKTPNGSQVGNARFQLSGNTLSVIASGLAGQKTAVTIDPSVVVTSTSDFQTGGNNESMIDFSTAGQINRGGLTGGSVGAGGSWTTSANALGAVLNGHTAAAYNGYLYTIGGKNGSSGNVNTIAYAVINSDGTIGTWANSTNLFTTARYGHTSFVYNGYMYVMGGTTAASILGDIQYAKINADGSLATFATTTSLPSNRYYSAAAVYNGYAYILGGCSTGPATCSAYLNDVQYALINADGTLGSWTSTSTFTTARRSHAAFASNGYMYVLGGYNGSATTDVQYAPITASGSLGAWVTTTSLPAARYAFGATIANGYLYVAGGYTTVDVASVLYAPINASGSLGAWATTAAITTARDTFPLANYNGYLYLSGGQGAGAYQDVQYAKIDPAGTTKAWATDSTHTITATAEVCTVAYNSFLYAIGGSTTDNGANNVATVKYSAIAADGTLGTWTATTSLPAGRGAMGCAAGNGYIYTIGGYTGSTSADAVDMYNTINANGTVGGTWTTGTTINSINSAYYPVNARTFIYDGYIYTNGGQNLLFSAPLNVSTGAMGTWAIAGSPIHGYQFAGLARVGKYVYWYGGTVSGTAQTYVEYASLANGTTGSWAATTVLPAAIGFNLGTTVNGCIYSVGGENTAGTSLNAIYWACPAANGTIPSWQSGPNLVTATTDLGVASYNGFIYGVGGYTTAITGNVAYTSVNNGGSGLPGTWATTTNKYSCDRSFPASVAYNGYLYVAGGQCAGVLKSDIQYAAISGNGNLGVFATDSHAFTTAREAMGLVAYNGYLYVLGGGNAGFSAGYNGVQYAAIGTSGALTSAFASAGGNYASTGRTAGCAYAYNGYLYYTGGYDGSSYYADTRYAPINSDGTIGTWADSGHNFSTARSDMGCFVANGYVYMAGGDTTSAYNDVQSAPINANGTLGTWVTTSSFHGIRSDFAVGVANGFVYLMGGTPDNGTTRLGSTLYAPINPGGTLGAWQISTTAFAAASYANTGLAYNGYLYEIDGNQASTNVINYAPLTTISRSATYSRLIDLGLARNVTSLSYTASLPMSTATPGIVPVYYKSAGQNGIFGSSAQSSAISGSGPCQGTTTFARYLLVNIGLDDSTVGSGIFPDIASTAANVSDFTVNYTAVHPAPNTRMRTGQTLQSGALSALDTCTP